MLQYATTAPYGTNNTNTVRRNVAPANRPNVGLMSALDDSRRDVASDPEVYQMNVNKMMNLLAALGI